MADDVKEQRSSLTRVIAASMIGTTIEWYDFFLYGTAAALVFNRLFNPRPERRRRGMREGNRIELS